jgi:hypothetical protein
MKLSMDNTRALSVRRLLMFTSDDRRALWCVRGGTQRGDSPMRSLLVSTIVVAAATIPLGGQVPVAGRVPDAPASASGRPHPAPRLANGQPDLGNGRGSWNPRVTANLAGLGDPNRSQVEKIVDVPFQPWAKALYETRQADLQRYDPESRCLPPGLPRMMATPFPFQIFQLSDRVLFIFEGGAHVWRTVYTDGRAHPADPNPSFLGDSIGHWEGDTLVADAIGFNEATWLDQAGHPHTEALHIVERFSRPDEMTLRYEVTIDDPHAYTKPWTTAYAIPWAPGIELFEYICQENNKDLRHMVGK